MTLPVCPSSELEGRADARVKVGETYRFNNVMATVVEASPDEIVWVNQRYWSQRHQSSKRHSVPRWYFERYSSPANGGSSP